MPLKTDKKRKRKLGKKISIKSKNSQTVTVNIHTPKKSNNRYIKKANTNKNPIPITSLPPSLIVERRPQEDNDKLKKQVDQSVKEIIDLTKDTKAKVKKEKVQVQENKDYRSALSTKSSPREFNPSSISLKETRAEARERLISEYVRLGGNNPMVLNATKKTVIESGIRSLMIVKEREEKRLQDLRASSTEGLTEASGGDLYSAYS